MDPNISDAHKFYMETVALMRSARSAPVTPTSTKVAPCYHCPSWLAHARDR